MLAVGRLRGVIVVEIGNPKDAVCGTFWPLGRCLGATVVDSTPPDATVLEKYNGLKKFTSK